MGPRYPKWESCPIGSGSAVTNFLATPYKIESARMISQSTSKAAVQKRLKKAVHRHKAVSRAGIAERLFTSVFTRLVYAQIWEDPEVDMAAMELAPGHHVVTIASGGCNMMSYLTASPAKVTALDLNPAHVALGNLKITGAARLPSYDEFYRFFGEANCLYNVALYRRYLQPNLDAKSKRYWDGRGLTGVKRINLFSKNIYAHGLLGYFIGWAHMLTRLYRIDFTPLLEAKSLGAQRIFFDTVLGPLFERPLLRWITTNPSSLYGLGIPPSQYESLAGQKAMAVVLKERLEKLVCDFPISENYFAWQAFARRYAKNGEGPLPPYLQRENYELVRDNSDRTHILNQSYTAYLSAQGAQTVDRYVLLDAQDWMDDDNLNALWQEITRTARIGARVIFRTAAPEDLLPGRVDPDILDQWHYHQKDSLEFGAKDRSSIYGGFHLYSLKGATT